MSEHPSFLALDRHAVRPLDGSTVGEHVERCPACRSHVERVRSSGPVPDWARDLSRAPARASLRWSWLAAAAALAAGVLVIALRPARPHDPESTTVRGSAAVGVYVRRGSRVFLWDGRQPVVAGDRIRLKVIPEGFAYVTVLTRETSGGERRLRVLFAAEVDPGRESVLPAAWQIDAAPGPETLIVSLSQGPLAPGEIVRAEHRADAAIWVRRLELPKASRSHETSP
jgi:hypothetical protein